MKFSVLAFSLITAAFMLAKPARAQIVTFNVNFESPTYSLGFVGAGAGSAQDNWYGYGYEWVTNSVAHSGTQSLFSTGGPGPTRAFEVPPPYLMSISKAENWYMEAYVYVTPGSSGEVATFAPASSLGSAFYISIHGDGTAEYNSGVDLHQTALGAGALNQWLRLRIEHPVNDLNIEMSVTGTGVNDAFSGYYATPWNPSMLTVGGTGTAFWDDIYAVSGGLAVPEPAVGTLCLLCLVLATKLRQRVG